MIKLLIPGEPVSKLRPRVTKFASYTPAKTKNYEVFIKELFCTQYPKWEPIQDKPLKMIVNAYFAPPISSSKAKLARMLSGEILPTKKPDVDNLIKVVGDSLNGLAYHDDAQIVKVLCSKYYSNIPRMEVIIELAT